MRGAANTSKSKSAIKPGVEYNHRLVASANPYIELLATIALACELDESICLASPCAAL